MPNHPPTDLRQHRAQTNRNLLIGFAVLLVLVGGGLIYLAYGGWGLGGGLVCFVAAAGLVGVVGLILLGLERLSNWLEARDEK